MKGRNNRPKKVKLHKETKRIVGAIKKGGTPTYSSKVNVGAWKTFNKIVTELSQQEGCYDTVVIIGATVERSVKFPQEKVEGDRHVTEHFLYLAVMIPSNHAELKDKLLAHITVGIDAESTSTEMGDGLIQLTELKFSEATEQSPFKVIDQVLATATAFLKKEGIIEEEEEEYEFGFDDIDSE